MKKLVSFKHFVIALAMTFAGLATFSACKDQNYDFDSVHALTSQEKFTDTFIKAFGQPAEGHMWGFDKPWMEKLLTRAETRGMIAKVESEYVPYMDTYGTAPNITDLEHKEVFEWFSTHKVTWEKTTQTVGHYCQGDRIQTEVEGYIAKEDFSKIEVYDWGQQTFYQYSAGQVLQEWQYNSLTDEDKLKVEWGKGWNEVGKSAEIYQNARLVKANGTIIEGDFFFPQNDYIDDRIIQMVYGQGTRGTHTLTEAVSPSNNRLPSDNSIWTYSPGMGGTCNVGLTIDFTSAWVQHVASEYDTTLPDITRDICAVDDKPITSEVHMDYLQFYGTDGNTLQSTGKNGNHTNDFNGNHGYGWGQQYVHPLYGKDYYFNGILIFDADFTNTTVSVSLDSQLHDKWIIVYLKGNGYEGWYLGFDLESAGKNKSNCIKADGYCNNWIIKLTAVNEAVSTEPVRLMCEDLGGERNEVTIGNTLHISDIDYNDIVLDVIPSSNKREVTLTLQAAGGTLPLTVWYNTTCLFETHELFNKHTMFDPTNVRKMPEASYKVMYNTGESTSEASAQSVTLLLDGDTSSNGSDNPRQIHVAEEDFDINKLYFKVCRFETSVYLGSSAFDYSDAIWVNINNIAGQAPLKLCVPLYINEAKTEQVHWLLERHSINLGYPDFVEWVKDPTKFFWTSQNSIHSEHLK